MNATNQNLHDFYQVYGNEIGEIYQSIRKNSQLCEEKLDGKTPDTNLERALGNLSDTPLRRSLTPYNVPANDKYIHLILIQAVRVAALLHDVGHPPFSHIVEYAMRDVYNEYSAPDVEQTKRSEKYLEKMKSYFEGNNKLHEQMGMEISESILRGVILRLDDYSEAEEYSENTFELIVMECVMKMYREDKYFADLHRIIDSSLDGDRLDYVTRDSVNSGLNAGRIDYKRIISDMHVIMDKEHANFCVPMKAINSIEDFIKRRYNIYKDIIYHHHVIKTDYLLQSSVKFLIEKYLKDDGPVDDEDSTVIPFDSISGLWFPLGSHTIHERDNALSQWNDSWLMTVLKNIYYTQYYRNRDIEKGSEDFKLESRLCELLRNTKRYYSLIKRSEDFELVDKELRTVILHNSDEIRDLITEINRVADEGENLQGEEEVIPVTDNSNGLVDIKGTLDFIEKIITTAPNNSSGLLFNEIYRRTKALKLSGFKEIISKAVEEKAKEVFKNTDLYDVVVEFKSISVGLDKPIYFYDDQEKIHTLDEISGIANILRLDADYQPGFYIYIFINDRDDIVDKKRNEFLKDVGSSIGSLVVEQIRGLLKEEIVGMEN
jgi:HD superfamily phosphohydrolase